MSSNKRGSKRPRTCIDISSSPVTAVPTDNEDPNADLLRVLSRKKEIDDLFVEYYFANTTSQEDRNFAQRALYIFASRMKRDRLLTPEQVDTEIVVSLVMGMLGNGSELAPFNIPSRSPKHISAFVKYMNLRRASHNNLAMFISFDGGGFFPVL